LYRTKRELEGKKTGSLSRVRRGCERAGTLLNEEVESGESHSKYRGGILGNP